MPNIDWNTQIRVGGDVRRYLSISMKQLTKMKSITLPVLLVSGGNRRKELNMMRKTIDQIQGQQAGQQFVDWVPLAQYFNELALIESPRSTTYCFWPPVENE